VISVMVVDDHAVVRAGLRELLGAAPDLQVVATAEDGERAVALYAETQPEVVLMDLSMPGMDGVEATRRIKQTHPDTQVILLSAQLDDEVQREGEGMGVYCYLAKGCSDNLIVDMVTRAINLKNEFAR